MDFIKASLLALYIGAFVLGAYFLGIEQGRFQVTNNIYNCSLNEIYQGELMHCVKSKIE